MARPAVVKRNFMKRTSRLVEMVYFSKKLMEPHRKALRGGPPALCLKGKYFKEGTSCTGVPSSRNPAAAFIHCGSPVFVEPQWSSALKPPRRNSGIVQAASNQEGGAPPCKVLY